MSKMWQPRSPPPPQLLPEDLIFWCILTRLPVRSLFRFAAVCKAWRDLILGDAVFAAMQAQSPSPASAALTRFHNGRLEVLGRVAAAFIAPPDPSFSFLPVGGGYQQLELCACTGGLVLLTAVESKSRKSVFCVHNPATRRFHLIWYHCPRGVAGLAYDPAAAAARGYDVVVASTQGTRTCRFFRFSSRAAGSGWQATRDTLRFKLFEELLPKPAVYAGGRVHWLTNGSNIVWHDVASGLSGTLPSPPCASGRLLEGSMVLAEWRGRLRLARTSQAGLGVWELSSYGAAWWDPVLWRSWRAIPGVVRPKGCFLWSVVPAGMEAGGEVAVGLAVLHASEVTRIVDGAAKVQDVWCRVLLRYDTRTGRTAAAAKLSGKNVVLDSLGTVFGYHSSLAALPRLL